MQEESLVLDLPLSTISKYYLPQALFTKRVAVRFT